MRATAVEGQTAFAPALCFEYRFHVTDGQNTRDQITRGRRSKHAFQIAFCAFHSYLVEVQMNVCYIRATQPGD